jgi:hypothetical protein
MTTALIRERLCAYIQLADDKKVEAIYTIVESEIAEKLDLWDDEDFINELDRRIEELESGKVKGISRERLI